MDHYNCHFPRMRYKHCKFGCDRSITKGCLIGEESTLSSISQRLLEDIPWFATFSTLRACALNTVSLVANGQ